MGACCGGTMPPENRPNIDTAGKFDTARASTLLKENDPELQALIKQQKSQKTKIVQSDEDDEEKQPLNTKKKSNNTSDITKSMEFIATSDININSKSKSKKSKKSKKKHHHQHVPSESMDSAIITETQTMVIHEAIGTNGNNNLSVPGAAVSISADTSVASDSLLGQSSIDHKLAILNEDNDANNIFPKSSSNDIFERKPSSKQEILDEYLLTMDDIKTWSDNIAEQLANNNMNYCTDKCDQTMAECECIKRFIFILKLYNQCINENKTDISINKIMEYLSPYEAYQCINDYFHFCDHHKIQYSNINDIKHYFINECGDCIENKCVSFIRNHRNRYKKTTEQYYDCDESNYNLIAIQQLFDSIHCDIFHNVMYENNKLSKQENKKRKIHMIRKRHCNLYTIDTGIQDMKTDEEIQYEIEQKIQEQIEQDNKMPELNESGPSITTFSSQLTQILQQQSSTSTPAAIPKNKLHSKNTCKLVSPKIPRQRPNSLFLDSDAGDPNYIASAQEYTYLPYSFGQHMFYEHDSEFQLPKYSDLKKELVLNTKAPLNEYQWSIEDKKAEILQKTYKIASEMSLDQIVSVLVYCNYNSLRQELQKSFAKKTEHKSYFHWGQLLFSVIKQFGHGETEKLNKSFPNVYCALNYPYKFYSFTHFNFTGLFSTSQNVNIVECSNTFRDGMILKLNCAPFWQAQFMDLSVVYSDFKDEQQQLFGCLNGCVLQIDEMFTCYDIRQNTLSYKHRNKKFIAALQLFEQIVIDITYIDDEQQYKWLNNSIQNAEQKNDDFDENEYTVLKILQSMIYDCLSENSETRLTQVNKYIEIPTFIKTQFGYFGHYYRETEFCKLCFDTKKIEMLPREIQKYFMNDKIIVYNNWCKLFPNDRIICVKNVDINKYESFINLFATFVNELGGKYCESLQCIDIDTNSNVLLQNVNDMINKKNESKFKYANWTLSYDKITKNNEIGNENKENNYSILISKNEVIHHNVDENKDQKTGNVVEKQQEIIDDNTRAETGRTGFLNDTSDVEEISDNIEQETNDNEKGNIEVVESSDENEINENNIVQEEQNDKKETMDVTDDRNANKENNKPEPVMNDKSSDNISSPSEPQLDTDVVSELQHKSLILSEEYKQSNNNTPQSTDTWGTLSPQPFANRWGFNTDNASTADDNTPISVADNTSLDTNKDKNKDDNNNNNNNLPLEDTIWNSYIEKWGYEPKTPQQLQLFSKDPQFEKHLSFKNAKLHFTKRKGQGKITK